MVSGSTDTSTPAGDDGCAVGGTWVGTAVAGMGVAEAGIWVGTCVAGIGVGVAAGGITVFVGREAGLVGCDTVTERSHPADMRAKMARSRKALFMIEFPFSLDDSHQRNKTPPPLGESCTGQVDSNVNGLDQGTITFSNSYGLETIFSCRRMMGSPFGSSLRQKVPFCEYLPCEPPPDSARRVNRTQPSS
jgi:hypothetical protein